MQFKVPQFLEIEDKIFGPFTFKQFVYVAGGAGAAFIAWTYLPHWIAIFLVVPIIALASIAAKVVRDRLMTRLAKEFPEYGFEIHKGYGTKMHYEALEKHGLCAIHRRSFIHLDFPPL